MFLFFRIALKHLLLMKQLVTNNQRTLFDNLFRTGTTTTFPINLPPNRFFELAHNNREFRRNYDVKIVRNPSKISSQQIEFVFETTYCEMVDGWCNKTKYKRKAIISPKTNSVSGWAFDSVLPV
ncbi:unnamed protein product [Caenorhabditis bovis]|uniref:Uncharacterized protein n=1 Tax=Caenorhabditis bovis TaxID=2654633 RepID=A0A8S1EMB6_9PELO|nr:unnamed protein product [Caenorhabditis bovis]